MPKKIIIVRHGETQYNVERRLQGWIDVPLNNIHPLQFLMSEDSVLVNNEVLYIVAEDGYLYPLPMKWNEFKAWSKNGSLTQSSKEYNLLSLVSIDKSKTEYAIDFNGRLLKLNPKSNPKLNSWTPVPEFKNNHYRKLTAPFFWSKKLEEI